MTRFLIIGALSAALLVSVTPASALAEGDSQSWSLGSWFGEVWNGVQGLFGIDDPVAPEKDGPDLPDTDVERSGDDPDGKLGDQVNPRR